jgi:hypothetical protein
MKEDAAKVLELLIEHELALKHLYQAYASALAESRELWHTLAGDEQGHADRLAHLRDEPAFDQWISQESHVKPQALRSSIDYVGSQISRAQGGRLSRMQALAVAKDLEDALIDRQLLLPAASGCMEIDRIMGELRSDTERHRQLIADALAEEKGLLPQ